MTGIISDSTARRIADLLERLIEAVERREGEFAPLRSAPRVPQWATGATCINCGGWHADGMCPRFQPSTLSRT